jgi:multiple sugar transport system substrate-binding protein
MEENAMKRKILFLFCIALLVFTVPVLVLAGGEKAKEEKKPEMKAAQGEWPRYPGAQVNFMWYPSPEMDAMKQLLPEFKQLTGIDVTLIELPHEDVFKKRMMDAVSGAGEFDIYPLQPSVTRNFADSGYIVPLDEFWSSPADVEYDDIFEGVRMMYEYKGKVYGLPLYPDVIMLFYNKKMMEDAGQPIPDTFKEFEKMSKSFMKDTDGNGSIDQWGSVLNLKGGDWSIMNNLALFMYMNKADWFAGQIGADNPVSKSDPKYMHPTLDDPKAIEAFEYLVKLYKDQVFMPGSITFSYFEAMETFSTGKVPTYLGFADQAPMIVGPDSLIKDQVRVAPVPTWKGVRRSFTGGWGASISSKAENPEAAYTFLKFFYGNSANQKRLSRYGQTPSRASVLFDPELQKEFVWYAGMGEMLGYVKPIPIIPEFEEFVSGLEPILTEALLGKITPKQAMLESNDLLDSIMKRAGYYK